MTDLKDILYAVQFTGAELDVIETALYQYASALHEDDEDWRPAWDAYHKVSTE